MKKTYISPDTKLKTVSFAHTLLAGSLGNGDTPQSVTLGDAPDAVGTSDNLAREGWATPTSVWDD